MTSKTLKEQLCIHSYMHDKALPYYELISVLGDDPHKTYTVHASYSGIEMEGSGASRKKAELDAASKILEALKHRKQIYVAGDLMTKGSQMQRAAEATEIAALGHAVYNPMANKEINDKANCDQEGLAERIVDKDTEKLMASDVVVIEPQSFAEGTLVELGQLLGMKDVAAHIQEIIYRNDWDEENARDSLKDILNYVNNITNIVVYPHYEDIRRVKGIIEEGDRRSLGINQYVYGACLQLSNGKGFYEWEEILEKLK